VGAFTSYGYHGFWTSFNPSPHIFLHASSNLALYDLQNGNRWHSCRSLMKAGFRKELIITGLGDFSTYFLLLPFPPLPLPLNQCEHLLGYILQRVSDFQWHSTVLSVGGGQRLNSCPGSPRGLKLTFSFSILHRIEKNIRISPQRELYWPV